MMVAGVAKGTGGRGKGEMEEAEKEQASLPAAAQFYSAWFFVSAFGIFFLLFSARQPPQSALCRKPPFGHTLICKIL